jgi:hypothetical protein
MPETRTTELTESETLLWNDICNALRGMQFGTVTLVVQDGIVVQVDRTEKKRLRRRDDKRS